VSIAAALSAYYPEQLWIPFVGYPLGALIGFGMVVGDDHWASDFVAGVLLGHAIGFSIGSAFRERVRGPHTRQDAGFTVAPLVTPTFHGLSVGRAW
jgi:hypothetical protein